MAGELASAIGLSYGAETPRGGSGGDKILGSILAENRRKAAEQAKRDAERDQRLKDIMKETSIDTDLDSRFRVEWEKESARRIDNIVQGYISEDVNTRVNASKQLYDLRAIKNNLQTQSDNYRKARAFAQQNPDIFSIGEYRKGDKIYTNNFEIFDDVDNIDNEELAQFSTLGAQFGLGTYKGSDGGETTVLQTNFNPVKMDTYDRLLNSSIKPEDYVITDVRKQKLGGRTYEYDEGELPEERRAALRAQVMQDPNYLLSYKQKAWQEYNKANQDVKGFTPFAEWMNSPESKVSDQSFVYDVNATLGRKKQMGQRVSPPPSSGGGSGDWFKKNVRISEWREEGRGVSGATITLVGKDNVKTDISTSQVKPLMLVNGKMKPINDENKILSGRVRGFSKIYGNNYITVTSDTFYGDDADAESAGKGPYQYHISVTPQNLNVVLDNYDVPEDVIKQLSAEFGNNVSQTPYNTLPFFKTEQEEQNPSYNPLGGYGGNVIDKAKTVPASTQKGAKQTPAGATQGKVFKPRGS